MKTLLEVADAARILHLTPARVRQLASAGLLPATIVTPRGLRLFEEVTVRRLAEKRAARLRDAVAEP